MNTNNDELELSIEELQNVQAGNSESISEDLALKHPELFRARQIEKLKQAREELELTTKKLQSGQEHDENTEEKSIIRR